MKKSYKGVLTVFLALTIVGFLSFCLVLIEGVRNYYLRVKAEQAMELSSFSVLSEFQQELFEQYGVFFLDLDYEQGTEQRAMLEKRAEKYLTANAEELITKKLMADKFCRATDHGGTPFFLQAVAQMQVEYGYIFLKEVVEVAGSLTENTVDLNERLNENKGKADEMMKDYVDEAGAPLFDISLPRISFPSINSLTKAVFGSTEAFSSKSIDLKECIIHRRLEKGTGIKREDGLGDDQLFHAYLFSKFGHYGLENEEIWKEELEYQLEYIISGEESDKKNIENIMWRIFLLRAGGDYLFYHQDAAKMAEAKGRATTLVGVTGNAALIQLVTEIFLISQAIEDGIEETKRIFAGEKVPLYVEGKLKNVKFGYEEYLYMFLNMTDRTEKVYRCMDVIEMETRKKSGYEKFRLDHCVDFFEVTWTYQFESLLANIPYVHDGIYEMTITRKIFYEI